jgi:hypothetical protein
MDSLSRSGLHVWPRGEVPSLFFVCSAIGGFWPIAAHSVYRHVRNWKKLTLPAAAARGLLATVPEACRRKPPSGIPLTKKRKSKQTERANVTVFLFGKKEGR